MKIEEWLPGLIDEWSNYTVKSSVAAQELHLLQELKNIVVHCKAGLIEAEHHDLC